MLYDIASWIITGLIVGALARLAVPGRQSMGLVMTILLGIVGAFVGGFIASLFTGGFNRAPDADWNWQTWLAAIAGGVLVLVGYLSLTGERRTAARV